MDRRGIKGDRLVEKNRQCILKTFGTLLRKRGKTDFLSPCSYAEFFQYLRDGRLIKGVFRSDLEDKLEQNGKN